MVEKQQKVRLVSLDVLRGFDMFWITGGSSLFLALLSWIGLPEPLYQSVSLQFKHCPWIGFRFWDLIFPLFVFMSGITIPFSLYSAQSKGTSNTTLQLRVIKRGLILMALGLSFSFFKWDINQWRPYTVLWLIGGANLIGASICLYVKKPLDQIAVVLGILVAYHLCYLFIELPGTQAGQFLPGKTFASFVDRHLISTNLYMGVFDPEGPVRLFSASSLCIMGCVAGSYIKTFPQPCFACARSIFAAGLILLALGYTWSFSFPMIKPLWSSSYVVFAAGWSCLFLATFYFAIDVMKWNLLNMLFIPIGMNSITIYVGVKIIDFRHTRDYFLKDLASWLSGNSEILIMTAGLIFFEWLFLYLLFRQRLFLRV